MSVRVSSCRFPFDRITDPVNKPSVMNHYDGLPRCDIEGKDDLPAEKRDRHELLVYV